MDAQTLLDKSRDRLRRHEGRYAEIARANPAFSYSWLSQFARGKIRNPTVANLQHLIEALDTFEGVTPAAQTQEGVAEQ